MVVKLLKFVHKNYLKGFLKPQIKSVKLLYMIL